MFFYVKKCFQNYVNFEGRAQRSEYWYFNLFNFIISILLCIAIIYEIISAFFQGNITPISILIMSVPFLLLILFGLATIIPNIAVTVRRLHDTNRAGWWMFIAFVPLIGGIWLLILMMIDSQHGDNQFGHNPKEIKVAPINMTSLNPEIISTSSPEL